MNRILTNVFLAALAIAGTALAGPGDPLGGISVLEIKGRSIPENSIERGTQVYDIETDFDGAMIAATANDGSVGVFVALVAHELTHVVQQSGGSGYAGAYHLLLTNYLGILESPAVADRTYDDEVWNQPLRGIRYAVPQVGDEVLLGLSSADFTNGFRAANAGAETKDAVGEAKAALANESPEVRAEVAKTKACIPTWWGVIEGSRPTLTAAGWVGCRYDGPALEMVYNLLSNVQKSKHDAAMAAIQNTR